jgi:hypothetical protein
MWTYTTYMLYTFLKGRNGGTFDTGPKKIDLDNFADFVFAKLWGEHAIVFHDSKSDLESDLKILAKLGLINYENHLKAIRINKEQMETLERIAHGMKTDPMRHRVPIINEYLTRIEAAV